MAAFSKRTIVPDHSIGEFVQALPKAGCTETYTTILRSKAGEERGKVQLKVSAQSMGGTDSLAGGMSCILIAALLTPFSVLLTRLLLNPLEGLSQSKSSRREKGCNFHLDMQQAPRLLPLPMRPIRRAMQRPVQQKVSSLWTCSSQPCMHCDAAQSQF